MRVSAAIMAHPDRKDMVGQLLSSLDRDVPVIWDDQGPPSGKGDRVWSVARRAWLEHDPSADFHVLIQDDALPCRDYLAGLEVALTHVPDYALVCPYFGRGRNVATRWQRLAQKAAEQRSMWIRSHTLMWGVSLAAPTRFIPAMVTWCDRKAGLPDDMRVGKWFQFQKIDTWYTWPSLVDHRLSPSLTKGDHLDRVAVRHHQGSALDLVWSSRTVHDPMITRREGSRSGPSSPGR